MSSTFCPLPWIHLASHPEGKVTLCCISDHTNNMSAAKDYNETGIPIYLNLNRNSVNDIINSKYFKNTRIEMLSGVKPRACLRCYKEEENGHRSKRIEETERFNFSVENAKSITAENGEIPVDLKFVELRLGNICNIKCRTCNPASSTKWAQEYKILEKELPFITHYGTDIDISWIESDKFWEDLLENSKNIELLYVNGGEPTLVEKHWKYLEKVVERGYGKNMTLRYNINMTNLPDSIIKLWKNFKTVQVFASIDDINGRNSYIRTGTEWSTVLDNLSKLKSYSWIETSICQTVSWLNIFYLDEFYDFFKEWNIPIHLNLVYDPVFLDPRILPVELKEQVLKKIKRFESHKFNFLKNHLSTGSNVKLFQQGLEYNNKLDSNRNQSFEKNFSEWNMLINDYLENCV